MMRNFKSESGQALVLVLLSLAVVLTLILFILARTVTDVAVSSRQEEAVRAFSAAEAGVERSLIVGSSIGTTQIGDATYTASVTSLASGANSVIYPIPLSSGETSTLWFTAHDEDGNTVCTGANPCFRGRFLNVCWGKSGTSSSSAVTPAIELSVFYESTPGDITTTKIARIAVDPYTVRATIGAGGAGPNNFVSPDAGTCTVGGQTFQFQKLVDFDALGIPAGSYGSENGLQFSRLRILYNSDTTHEIGYDISQSIASGGLPLPSQGILIDSSGTAGESNRRLSVFQGWPELPQVFEFAIYGPTGLTK